MIFSILLILIPSQKKVVKSMTAQNKNESIQCSIHNCVHHAGTVDYCTLDKIRVGTHEMNPTKKECTDCDSFQYRMS